MKNKIASLFLLSVVLVACKKDLDLQPEQSVSEEVALSSESTANSVLLGVYSTAQNLNVFGAQPQVMADLQSDNVEFVGSFPTLQEVFQYTTLSTNLTISGWWQDHYRVILRANLVIDRVPGIEAVGFTQEEKNQLVAEAKFMRAITYFNLLNIFSQPYTLNGGSSLGVPLVLQYFDGNVNFPARSTVAEGYTQIAKDLTEALPDLPDNYDDASDTRGRATKGAANALLSRLNLYKGEYQQAANYANDVIGSSLYQLAPDYSFYDGNTPEDVFSIQMSAIDNSRTGSGGWASYYRPATAGGRGDAPFSDDLVAAFMEEAGDKRLALSDSAVAADGIRRRFTLKFPDAVNNEDNAPLIRVTEMYLNRAEALAEIDGVNTESLTLINALRTRAGLDAWEESDFATDAEFIDAILNERRKELAFEGHRRMDLLRKGKALRRTGLPNAGQSRPGDDKVALPIPQREVDINPSLDQNPGY